MFKIGDKVVFVGDGETIKDANEPQINEIVIIEGYSVNIKGNYFLIGYRFSKTGRPQSFRSSELRPLDESFATEVLENILTKVKEEELELI